MFHLATATLALFVVLRFILRMPWRGWIKAALSVAALLASQHHLASRYAFGSMFSPEVPAWIIIFFNWAFGSILLLAGLQFVLDFCIGVTALLARRRVATPVWSRYAIGMLALSLAAVGVSQAIGVPSAKQVEVRIRALPRQFDSYRLVQLSDLHISRLFEAPWVEAVVRETNALKPDFIVVTGDLIDGTTSARARDVQPLSGLQAPDGVWVIPGNHEYYFGYPAWIKRFEELGMRSLANTHSVIRRGDADLAIAGVTDPAAVDRGFPGPDPEASMKDVPRGAATILLDHQPKNARRSARGGAALQLSGHTHGGLIVGFDKFIGLFNKGFVSGLYDVDGMPLYVNNGTALWNGFAIRLGKPSELTVIVLRAG